MMNARRQQGISLVFALITLVALMLASIALVRSVNTGSQILGNIGFQQDATATAEQAAAAATVWLTSGADLTINNVTNGYYASVDASGALDVTGQQSIATSRVLVDWDRDGACSYVAGGSFSACALQPSQTEVSVNGNVAKFVIFRLCSATGSITGNNCALPLTAKAGGSADKGAIDNNNVPAGGKATGQYFRIVVRAVGARGTTSFTETIVQY